MLNTDILQRQDPTLRKKALPVLVEDITSDRIRKILSDMKIAMDSQKDGIAIAAPQIGALLQIFMISGHLLKKADKDYKGDESDLIFFNPKITKLSKDKVSMEEGCLSVRWLYGTVPRSTRATITAYNEKGEKINRGASGLLAQIFQHETDHLHGILFTDRANEVWEMTEEEIKEIKKK